MRLSGFVFNFVILIPAALSCSCIEISSPEEVIHLDFCFFENVYVGKVVEATCNCLPSDDAQQANVYCNTLGPRPDGGEGVQSEVISRGSCVYANGQHYYPSLSMCSKVDTNFSGEADLISVDQPLPSVQNATNVEYSSCSYVCPFNEGGESDYWPCRYTLMVQEVFKGDLTPGDLITEFGPDVATTCSLDPHRILQYQQDYLVGIGGVCTPFVDWAEYDSYANDEIAYLRCIQEQYSADPVSTCKSDPGSITLPPVDACASASTLPEAEAFLIAMSFLIYYMYC